MQVVAEACIVVFIRGNLGCERDSYFPCCRVQSGHKLLLVGFHYLYFVHGLVGCLCFNHASKAMKLTLRQLSVCPTVLEPSTRTAAGCKCCNPSLHTQFLNCVLLQDITEQELAMRSKRGSHRVFPSACSLLYSQVNEG